MNFPIVVAIGAVFGALEGVGIFFEPKEPYKWQILFAVGSGDLLQRWTTRVDMPKSTYQEFSN